MSANGTPAGTTPGPASTSPAPTAAASGTSGPTVTIPSTSTPGPMSSLPALPPTGLTPLATSTPGMNGLTSPVNPVVIKSEPEEAAASAAATPVNTSKADADVEMKDASKEDENKGKENGKEDDKEKEKENAEEDTNGPDLSELFAARRAEENARRDRSLAEFLVMLDGYKPLIPEEVTEYYLQRAGFECSDPRLKRLLSLSAQRFISDLSRDAFHFAKLRTSGTAAGRGRPSGGVDRNRVVLTMDDLSLALGEHGVNVKKPDYYL